MKILQEGKEISLTSTTESAKATQMLQDRKSIDLASKQQHILEAIAHFSKILQDRKSSDGASASKGSQQPNIAEARKNL